MSMALQQPKSPRSLGSSVATRGIIGWFYTKYMSKERAVEPKEVWFIFAMQSQAASFAVFGHSGKL